MTLKDKVAAARTLSDSRTLVCTRDRSGDGDAGWTHGGTCSSDGWYELSIFRFEESGKFVGHPMNGKRWKYRNTKLGESATLVLIRAVCDKIGLQVGALKVYKQGKL